MHSTLLLISIIISWGLWAFFAKLAVEKIGLQSVFWVNIAVAVFVTAYLFITKEFIPLKTDLSGVTLAIVSGILAGIGTVLFYILLSKNPVGLLVAITALYPMVTIILSIMFLGESLSTTKMLGIFMALGALFLLNLK